MTLQQIQNLLQYLGYYTIRVDGISGPGTEQAVRGFRQPRDRKGYKGLKVTHFLSRRYTQM